MRLIPARFSSERRQSDAGKERSLLYLNVYDLTPMNDYLYWFGLGIFHSGIEVHSMEYGFGAHDYPSSGVFEVEPRSCPGFVFRRSILLGSTEMSRSEYRLFIEHLASKYHGDTYHLIAKNCNHFTDEVCFHLTGRHIPGWVNRLARIETLHNQQLSNNNNSPVYPAIKRGLRGQDVRTLVSFPALVERVFPKDPKTNRTQSARSFFNCLLPEQLQVTSVRQVPSRPSYSDDGSDSASVATLESEDDVEALDHHQLLTPTHLDVSFVKETPLHGKDQASIDSNVAACSL